MNEKNFVNQAIDSMPEPQQHVIEQEKNKSSDNSTIPSEDNSIYAKENIPKQKKERPDKGRRRGKYRSRIPNFKNEEKESESEGEKQSKAAVRLAAESSSGLLFLTAEMIGGIDFYPDDREQKSILDAFVNYYQIKGIIDIPPSLILISAISAYVMPRFSKPNTQSRFLSLFVWLKKKFRRKKDDNSL